jgi:hypothetical protein
VREGLRLPWRVAACYAGGIVAAVLLTAPLRPADPLAPRLLFTSLLLGLPLLLAAVAGALAWRRSVTLHPARWAVLAFGATTALVALAFVLLGHGADGIARFAALWAGLCAACAALLFVAWSRFSPIE